MKIAINGSDGLRRDQTSATAHAGVAKKVQTFFASYPQHVFHKKEFIIRAEETPRGVFYITEGRVSQYDITSSGNEVVVNVFKPGVFFPMSSAINNTPNHYFFEASTKVTTSVAPMADVVQFLKDNPDVLFDLLSRVYRGVDGVLRRMAHLMGGDAKTRLIFELLNAAYRFGEPQADGSIFIAFNESILAKHSGLARETVNRTIQGLKEQDLVTIKHDGIVVQSTSRLEALLDNTV